MKCRHCGKELIAVTMYIEAGVFNVPAATAVWWNLGAAAAAAPAAPVFTMPFCAHEPATEIPNTTGGNYE